MPNLRMSLLSHTHESSYYYCKVTRYPSGHHVSISCGKDTNKLQGNFEKCFPMQTNLPQILEWESSHENKKKTLALDYAKRIRPNSSYK